MASTDASVLFHFSQFVHLVEPKKDCQMRCIYSNSSCVIERKLPFAHFRRTDASLPFLGSACHSSKNYWYCLSTTFSFSKFNLFFKLKVSMLLRRTVQFLKESWNWNMNFPMEPEAIPDGSVGGIGSVISICSFLESKALLNGLAWLYASLHVFKGCTWHWTSWALLSACLNVNGQC